MAVSVKPRFEDTVPTAELARWEAIPVTVATDVSLGACQIDPFIRPLCPPGHQPRLFGRAVTVLCEPPDFGAVLYALDLIRPGDVLVIATHNHLETAMIGDILGGHLRRQGGRGLICDGAIRDVAQLAAWRDFSVFTRAVVARGPSSAERGSVNVPVLLGGRWINPGDLIIGDDEGLVSLSPSDIQSYIGPAEAKLEKEGEWRANLEGGRSMAETFGLPTVDQE